MDNKGLLFIPDISGFTRFVNQTDIEHSSLIIRELLEVLIESNETGLQVSEIEGDAILFYKFGEAPELASLYSQVQKMFCDFHRSLIAYDRHKFCQCNACLSAVDLSLKVITHYGEFTGYNIQQFSKLIGKDVIVAHQLLKNDINQHEYWLVTDNLLNKKEPADFTNWMRWEQSVKATESGEVGFHYTQLGKLKDEINPVPPLNLELGTKEKLLTVTREFKTDIIRLFHACGDFRYRHRWEFGVNEVEEVSHFLPRLGMRYRLIMDRGTKIVYASSYQFSPDKIQFSETDEQKKHATYYILENSGNGSVKLTLEFYEPKSQGKRFWFNLFEKKKLEQKVNKSFDKLEKLVKEIKLPGDPQPPKGG